MVYYPQKMGLTVLLSLPLVAMRLPFQFAHSVFCFRPLPCYVCRRLLFSTSVALNLITMFSVFIDLLEILPKKLTA